MFTSFVYLALVVSFASAAVPLPSSFNGSCDSFCKTAVNVNATDVSLLLVRNQIKLKVLNRSLESGS